MMRLTKEDIKQLDKVKRLNIINSITGIKPGNLIGTKSSAGHENLAIFSSVVHLGSNPALLGFVLRPHQDFRRDTFNNILENGVYTINHIPNNLTKNAHYTSGKFEAEESEFEVCKFTPYYSDVLDAPYVEESPIKIGMEYLEMIPIKANDTALIVGEVKELIIADKAINDLGQINLEASNTAGISGLDTYYKLEKIDTYPFVRMGQIPEFK